MTPLTRQINSDVSRIRNWINGCDFRGCGEGYGELVLREELKPLCPFFTKKAGEAILKPLYVYTYSNDYECDIPF